MFDSKLGAFLLVYGPSGLGFVLLTVTCVLAKRNVLVLWASIFAIVLHLASVLMIETLVGMGEAWSGQSAEHNLPGEYFEIGLLALAVPVLLRFVYRAVFHRHP